MRHRRFGRTGWQVSEMGYGMWGMGGWTGSDDEESRRSLDRAIELGCNFFDTAYAYGLGRSETAAGRGAGAPLGDEAVHRDEGAAQKPEMARPRRHADRRRLPLRLHHRDDGEEPRQSRRRDRRSPATSCVERRVGGRRRMEKSGAGSEAAGARARVRHQRQPLGTVQRHQGAAHGSRRRGAGRLQRLRSGTRRTSCSLSAASSMSRSLRAYRSTRAASPARSRRTAAGPKATGATSISRRRILRKPWRGLSVLRKSCLAAWSCRTWRCDSFSRALTCRR